MGFFDAFKNNQSSSQMSSRMADTINSRRATQLADSMRLIENTTNPETYFNRYKMASNYAVMLLPYHGPVYGGLTSSQINYMLSCEQDIYDRGFINRLFAAKKEDLLTYNMHDYGYHLSEDNKAYFVQKLGGRKYHFCKVRFNNMSYKLYTYITKDKSIKVGDTVTIPSGTKAAPESVVLQVEEVFDASLEQLEFPIEALRCVERKLKNIVCPHCGASIQIDTVNNLGRCTRCQSEFYFL